MPTIIDALLIQIGIEPSQLIKGAKESTEGLDKVGEAATRTGKKIEQHGKAAIETFSKIRSQVIGLFAAFATGVGLESFLKDITVADSGVGRFAENIGTSIGSVAAFEAAIERTGGTAAGALSALQNWASNVFKAQHGLNPDFIGWYRSLEALSGKTIQVTGPIMDQLASLADALQSAFKKNPVAAQMLAGNMGLADALNLLKQGRAAFNAEMSKSADLGLPNDADIKAAQERLAAWKALVTAWGDIGRKIATDFTGAIVGALHALTDLAEWAKAHPELADEITAIAAAFVLFKTVSIPLGLLRAVTSLGASTRELGTAATTTAADLRELAAAEASAGTVSAATAAKLNASSEAMLTGAARAMRWRAALGAVLALTSGFELEKMLDEEAEAKKRFGSDTAGFEAWKKKRDEEAQKSFGQRAFGWVPGLGGIDWSKPLFAPGGLFGPSDTSKAPGRAPSEKAGGQSFWNRADDWIKRNLGAPQSSASPAPSGSLANSSVGNLIGRGEGDYNSVNRGAKGKYKAETEDLSDMTVADVLAAQQSGKFKAAGRYEIIPSTLKDAVAALGLTGKEKFDKALQDRVFEQYLVAQKRPAIGDYIAGRSNDLRAAVKAAAAEWASIADPDTGRSRYAGNNRATISADEFARALVNARGAQAARAQPPKITVQEAGAPAPKAPQPVTPTPQPWLANIQELAKPHPEIAAYARSMQMAAAGARYNISHSSTVNDNRTTDNSTRNATISIQSGGRPEQTAEAVKTTLRQAGLIGTVESGAV